MESSKQHFERQPSEGGTLSDLKHLQSNTQATVGELREFLGQLKGRSPQEVMGIIAQSSLVQGIAAATAGCVVLLAVFTIVPYFMSDGSSPGPGSGQNNGTPAVASVPDNSEADTQQDDGRETDTNSEPDLKSAADAMGISEAAEADPETNPLDSKLDKLLDGID